jgi:NAD/NADP transhydrogenase beta subunit
MFNEEQRGFARERRMSLAPILIWLATAYAGLSTAVTGFVLDATALIVAGGILVCSGSVLANLITKATKRSESARLVPTRKASSASHCVYRPGR